MNFHRFGEALVARGKARHQRSLVIVAGDRRLGFEHAAALFRDVTPVLITRLTPAPDNAITTQIAKGLLGSEIDGLLVDCHDGVDPDSLGILSGALQAGAILCFLVPGQTEIPVASLFQQRLLRILSELPDAIRIEAENPIFPDVVATRPDDQQQKTSATLSKPATDCQSRAVDAIIKVVNGQRRRPTLLLADRGRGKSAALGIAAGRILGQSQQPIIVTSSRRASTDALFRHAEATCPEYNSALAWRAVDQLVDETAPCQLLIVDEAATLPIATLEALLGRYPRTAMATTVHGYEGSGRGFTLRFSSVLEESTRGARTVRLEQPVRWSIGDPVESAINALLILDAELPVPKQDRPIATPEIKIFAPNALAANEPRLRDIFSLLVLAHYKTRPGDLVRLLDSGTMIRYAAIEPASDRVVGVVIVNREGNLEPDVAEAIANGSRRPEGQTLAALLASQGQPTVATLDLLRVVRIVVHPHYRRSGIGRAMLKRISLDHPDADVTGATFAMSEALLGFWGRCGYQVVQIGRNQTVQTGSHSVTLVRCQRASARDVIDPIARGFQRNLILRLRDSLATIEPTCVQALLADQSPGTPDEVSIAEVKQFVEGRRNAEEIPASLAALAAHGISRKLFSRPFFVIERLLLGRPWRDCSEVGGDVGWREGDQLLREQFGEYLSH